MRGAYSLSWWQRRRLQKWEDRLADAERRLDKWGWSYYPSEIRKAKVGIERARSKVERLRGNRDDKEDGR